MGNSQGQLKSSRFENALHMSIEQSLRSSSATPHPLFSQLYLEKDIKVGLPEVLPVPPDHVDPGRQVAISPRGTNQQESVHQRGLGPPQVPPRLVSPLPPIPGPIPLVHGPIQRVVLPPSSLAQSYHQQRYIIPGQCPPPHAMPPLMCNVPPPPSLRHSDKPPTQQHHHSRLLSPKEERSPRGQRSSASPARPATLEGCQDVGFCKAGADIRLSSIHAKQLNLPDRFVLVGATSPYLPEDTLVAAVDGRFLPLPGDAQSLHLTGFSGDCVGCGKRGFRYFSEFAKHINLKVVSEAKKENHLRYYITLGQGQMVKGALIPWQADPAAREPRVLPAVVEVPLQSGDGRTSPDREHSQGIPDIHVKEESDPPGSSKDLKQPPKKRHRFHNLDEEKQAGESPVKRRMHSHPPSPEVKLPSSETKHSAFIPANLAARCGTKVVILECCGSPPTLHGHVSDVSFSALFRRSFLGGTNESSEGVQVENTLNQPTRILLLIKYLLQLGPRLPYCEGFAAALTRAVMETVGSSGGTSSVVTGEQLPSLAKLSADASHGSGRVVVTQDSLAAGLTEVLQSLASSLSADRCPDYTFIVCNPEHDELQFCVVVSGPLQARALIEGSTSSADRANQHSTIAEDILLLASHFDKSCQGIELDDLIAKFSAHLDGKVFAPFNSAQLNRIDGTEASEMKPTAHEELHKRDTSLQPHQIRAAMMLLSRVCSIADRDRISLDLGRFTEVGLLIITPPSEVLYEQTVDRLHSSRILLDVNLVSMDSRDAGKPFVMKLDDRSGSQSQLEDFVANVRSKAETLFVVVLDSVGSDQSGFQEIADAPNVLLLHVSSTPYSLQTRNSPIPRENEIHMDRNQDVRGDSSRSRYFGISDYQGSLGWTNQTPLLQYDETFELMAESLLKSYPELHSRIARTYLLVRQYSVAILNAATGQNHRGATDATMLTVQDLIASPLADKHGRGPMVLLRIPSPQLAALAYQRLRQVRDRLGLSYRFEVILAGPDRAVEVHQHFLQRLQGWRGLPSSWTPATYEDLDGLPCILILTNEHTQGESMPKSLKVIDLRLVNEGMFDLAGLERELGLASSHVTRTRSSERCDGDETVTEDELTERHRKSEQDDTTATRTMEAEEKPPLVLVSRQAFVVLKEAQSGGYSSSLPPCSDTRWMAGLRPPLTSSSSEDRSSYYREWTESFNERPDTMNHPRRLLLYGPPRIGKTGAYLHFCRVLHHMLVKLQEVEVDDDQRTIGPSHPDSAPLGGPPDLSRVERMTFDTTIYQERYKHCSLIWHPGMSKQDLTRRATADVHGKKNSTVVVKATKLTSHNSFHSCEECQSYCTGDSTKEREVLTTTIQELRICDTLFGEVSCQFIIPSQQKGNFIFDHETGSLRSLHLPVTGRENEQAVKSPMFMLMRNLPEQSLANLYHVMDGCRHTLVLVCKEKDTDAVRKQWPCHTVLVLPLLANIMGGGGLKYFVKRVATQNLRAERQRYQTLGVDPGKVWPLILIMEDWLFSWRKTDMSHSVVEVSLSSVIGHVEALPDITQFALIGVDQWSTRSKVTQRDCRKSFVDNMVFLNVRLTEGVQYNPYKFFHEDIDFSWRVHNRQLPVCTLTYLQVMVKSTLRELNPPDIIVHPSTLSRGPITADRFLVLPGADDCALLLAPPHFVVEKYLSDVAFQGLLSSGVDLLHHPVLVMEGYISLGRKIPVFPVSSTAGPVSELEGMVFSGLVIDTCFHPVPSKQFIQQSRFITAAQLVLFSPDVNSARTAVMELDLERNWQLETLQTANTREDGPINVIRGTYKTEPNRGLGGQI